MIGVHINNHKEIRVIDGNFLPNINLDLNNYIPEKAAIGAAIKHLKPIKRINSNQYHAVRVVYDYNEMIYLSWKITINSEDPLGEFIYYLDASNGEYIDSYNNLKNILDRKIFDMENNEHAVMSLRGKSVRKEYDDPSADSVVNSAYDLTGEVYEYYKNKHNRDSYDDKGACIQSVVHYGKNYDNAYWDGHYKFMVFGDGV